MAIEEVGDLAAAEIVDRGVPVRVEAVARVGMFVERGAVEMGEAMRVDREMRRHPVEDDAEARRMRTIDEAREARRIAEAAGRREQADRLIAPGGIERMLGDRQQFEMGEAQIDDIGDQRVGEFVVGEERGRRRRAARSRGEPRRSTSACVAVRRSRRLAMNSASVQEKSSVCATTEAVDGRSSASKPNGSAFSGSSAPSAANDLVFVDRADRQFGHEDLPEAAVDALAHLAAAAVPVIEVADDRDARRVRRPNREEHAVDAFVTDELRAEPSVELPMRALPTR